MKKNAPVSGISCFAVSLAALASVLTLSSCTVSETGQLVIGPTSPAATSKSGKTDPESPYHSQLHHIFVDEKALPSLNPSNSRIEIDLGDQRARVYRTGKGKEKLVIETQISTGKQGHGTPDGDYRILEKNKTKKSNLYGIWVDPESGEVLDKDGDSRKPPAADAKFKGAPMPYWLRVTSGGVGMHIGFVPGYPASHGCIRIPKKVQPLIYSMVRVGTPVHVTH